MKGEFKVRVHNKRNSFSFTLRRNITVLKGNSGRGKTTLFEMIHAYNRYGKASGVSVSCDRNILAVSGEYWETTIHDNPGAIIMIDENDGFIKSYDFARVVRNSDNYYLLITRNYLMNLPISVEEIYELEGNKNKKFVRIYQQIEHMYDRPVRNSLPFVPDLIVTEDSNSGCDFFKHICRDAGIECISSLGKTKIIKTISKHPEKKIVIVADGAAFGAEMADMVQQQKLFNGKLAIFLPESFEWLVLSSGVIQGIDQDMMDHPEMYAESQKYMSWEQYFTDLLIKTAGRKKSTRYSKEKLSDYYLQDNNVKAIKEIIKGIKIGS